MTTININVPDSRIADLFICAVEGGSTYWCNKIRPLIEEEKKFSYYNYMLCGGFIAYIDEEVEEGSGLEYRVARAEIDNALKLMAEKYPQHYADFMNENEDADTGDVFLQLCLFKEVVFG